VVVGDAPLRVPRMVQSQAGRTGVRPLQDHRKLESPNLTKLHYRQLDCNSFMLYIVSVGTNISIERNRCKRHRSC